MKSTDNIFRAKTQSRKETKIQLCALRVSYEILTHLFSRKGFEPLREKTAETLIRHGGHFRRDGYTIRNIKKFLPL